MFTPDPSNLIGEYLFEDPLADGTIRNTANPGTLDGSIIHNQADYPLSTISDVPTGFPHSNSLDYNVLRTLLTEGVDPASPGNQSANAQYVEVNGFPDVSRITIEAWIKVDYAKTANAFEVPAAGTFPDGEIGFGACPQPLCMSFAWYLFLSTLQTDRNLILTIIGTDVTQGLPKANNEPPGSGGSGGSGGVVSRGIVPGGDQWQHIAATVGPYAADPIKNIMRVYIDGIESFQQMITDFEGTVRDIPPITDQVIAPSTNAKLRLGIFREVGESLDYQYSGRMCGVRIYNRALTREQICADISADTSNPTVISSPPSINFGPVIEGLITTRPITIAIQGCSNTLITATFVSPADAFSFPLGNSITVAGAERYDGVSENTIWLAYTTQAVGSNANAIIQIDIPAAGFSEQIEVQASTRARLSVSSALVLDRSFSMSGNIGVPGIRKIDSLRESARTFINLMQDGDKIAIVRYNQNAPAPHFPLTNVGPEGIGAGRNEAITYLNGPELNPSGDTSIGDGVFAASDLLAPSTDDVRAMLVMTDGHENRDRLLADPDVQARLTEQTFAVGLGSPTSISTDALNAITSGSNRYLLVTGEIDTNNRFKLTKYFTQILSDIDNMQIVIDPDGIVSTSKPQTVQFSLNETDIDIDVILLSPAAKELYFALKSPDGTIIDSSNVTSFPNIKFIVENDVCFFRIRMPVFLDAPKQHIGVWKGMIGLKQQQDQQQKQQQNQKPSAQIYSFMVRSRSNFSFKFSLGKNQLLAGEPLYLNVSMSEYGMPVGQTFTVIAELTSTEGILSKIPLKATNKGQYELMLSEYLQPGHYTIRVKARGQTLQGNLIEREKTLTATVLSHADNNSPNLVSHHSQVRKKLNLLLICCLLMGLLLVVLIIVFLLK